ncbi:MAG TPA: cyclopropane-fatty-acyl-phospholipid synthase family protein [Candidatus Cybelea sp.]|nr:cyclopropane-fatty-acyl-phospholipid synthase family protein [Candidatus Cybelea sp.]
MTSVDVRGPRDVLTEPGLTRWMRLALVLVSRARAGHLTVCIDGAREYRFSAAGPGPRAAVIVHDQRVARRMFMGGSLGVAEAYLDGDFDSPDLTALVEWACINEDVDATLLGKSWYRVARRLYHVLRGNSRRGSRRNIASHYDLGNDFYRRWLDPGMTYSSAIFGAKGEDLEAAQVNKYRRLAEILRLEPGQSLLDIGCGWGGFACFAAREFNCRVTGITISREQFEYARARVAELGLLDKVQIELRDYRDIRDEFDRIVSIEMFEAVGERYWPVFFNKLRQTLRPGGRAALQVITIADRYFEDYRSKMDFIQRYVFPGGMLPSPQTFRDGIRNAGLRLLDESAYGAHYARTLSLWRQRFVAAWPDIRGGAFDERFRRMWEYYLCYCEGGFLARSIDVMQVAMTRD